MKRFIVPAFFVIDVDDNVVNATMCAEAIAGEMQRAANRTENTVGRFLMLDEELATTETPYEPKENDLPHTMLGIVDAAR